MKSYLPTEAFIAADEVRPSPFAIQRHVRHVWRRQKERKVMVHEEQGLPSQHIILLRFAKKTFSTKSCTEISRMTSTQLGLAVSPSHVSAQILETPSSGAMSKRASEEN